jgi:hypothetical protein
MMLGLMRGRAVDLQGEPEFIGYYTEDESIVVV